MKFKLKDQADKHLKELTSVRDSATQQLEDHKKQLEAQFKELYQRDLAAIKGKVTKQRDLQVKQICEQMTEEHFQEVAQLKDQLKTSEKEARELLSRIKRQEEYIEQKVK